MGVLGVAAPCMRRCAEAVDPSKTANTRLAHAIDLDPRFCWRRIRTSTTTPRAGGRRGKFVLRSMKGSGLLARAPLMRSIEGTYRFSGPRIFAGRAT
jgi:hypothetical protein